MADDDDDEIVVCCAALTTFPYVHLSRCKRAFSAGYLSVTWERDSNTVFLPCDCMLSNARCCCRNSVCPSARQTRVLWQNYMMNCGYFDTARNGDHSSFLTPTMVDGRCHLPSESCAQSDPPPSKNADFDGFPLTTSQL